MEESKNHALEDEKRDEAIAKIQEYGTKLRTKIDELEGKQIEKTMKINTNSRTGYEFVLNTQLASVLENVTSFGTLRDAQEHRDEKRADEVRNALTVQRFKNRTTVFYRKYYDGYQDAIQVSPDHDIRMTSLILYACSIGGTHVTLRVTECNNCLIQLTSHYPYTTDAEIEVQLSEKGEANGITLYRGHWYDIIVIIVGHRSRYGYDGQSEVSVRGVNFSFRKSPFSENGTHVSEGQIPGFRFKPLL